jgi:ADP-heptose:LPS heptosyltransferase
MGMGDELMVTGEVKRRAAGQPVDRKFAIFDVRKGGIHRWHELWEGNPRIAFPGTHYDEQVYNHGGGRPYIVSKSEFRWVWKVYRPEPGELFFNSEEQKWRDFTRGKVIIQPTVKQGASPNKQWGLERWAQLVGMTPRVPWLQLGTGVEPRIPGVPVLRTPTFRLACAALSGASAAVLQEGGLHHAAAALNIPAIVIFGGFISPAVTGYQSQVNLFLQTAEHPLGCGMRQPCRHCAKAMAVFTPQHVKNELEAFYVPRD